MVTTPTCAWLLQEKEAELVGELKTAEALRSDIMGMQEGLNVAKMENSAVKRELREMKRQNKALEEERDKLLSHQNHKQKIQPMTAMRQQINDLTEVRLPAKFCTRVGGWGMGGKKVGWLSQTSARQWLSFFLPFLLLVLAAF